MIIQADVLTAFVEEVFAAAGLSKDHASATARSLVWADLRGHPSHGIMRAPSYLSYLPKQLINPDAKLEIDFDKGALIRMNANLMIGPAALAQATKIVLDRAKDTAVAWGLVKDHSHAGAAGQYAKMISDAGMIAMIMVGSRPMMAYHGASNDVLGTNPIAIAIPGGPLLDMSTAAISKGKIAAFAAAGTPLPDGVALTKDGEPTIDAGLAATPLPLGGAKGAGLSLIIECMTSIALGNPLVSTALTDAAQMSNFRLNTLIVAMDVAAFGEADKFASDVAATMDSIKAQPLADGADEILIAGERGAREFDQRMVEGITLSEKAWTGLVEQAEKLGVTPPII